MLQRWRCPASGGIFVATRTSTELPCYERLPEMLMSASETRGCYPRQRVETVARAVELLSFVQDRIGTDGYAAFAERLRRENFRWADLVQET
jgi:hypothetical protein